MTISYESLTPLEQLLGHIGLAKLLSDHPVIVARLKQAEAIALELVREGRKG